MGGPYFPGRAIYAMAYDARDGRNRLWAAVNSSYWGSYLSTSNDFGKSWTEPETYGVKFPEDAENSVKQIWQIVPGNSAEPNTLYCGVEPAALFRSDDAGETWSLVKGLYDHPHRPQWQPGGGGLCLHTILPDPENKDRMHIAISTGGVYRTDDGGKTWEVRNKGVRAQFLPPDQRYPEFGQCVHKIVSHPSNPKRLFLQNHWGLYRSDDGADSWQDIANGVPSDFGFALEIDHHDPNTAYIIPLESDEFRCTPEAKLRVYRTRNAGAVVAAADKRPAAGECIRDRVARRNGGRHAQSHRTLFRYAQRQTLRYQRWRRIVERDRGRTACGGLCQDGRGLKELTRTKVPVV